MDHPDRATDRIHRFLETEPVIWLATVDQAGHPGLVPVWFWWDGEAVLVVSKPGARKVRNIRHNGRVMLALGDAEADFDVGLIEARAELVDVSSRAVLAAGLAAKYADRMAAAGLSPSEFADTYRQVIRIMPARPLPWRGRSRSLHRDDGSPFRAHWAARLRGVLLGGALRPRIRSSV